MKRENAVKDKSFDFAVRTVNVYRYLADKKREFVLSKQLLRSGTAIGALATSSEASAATYAQRHNVPKFFTDYRDLLALPEVDMIDLCLPNHLHRPVADVWGLTLLIQLGAGIGILSALLALFLPKTGAVISSAAAKSVPA